MNCFKLPWSFLLPANWPKKALIPICQNFSIENQTNLYKRVKHFHTKDAFSCNPVKVFYHSFDFLLAYKLKISLLRTTSLMKTLTYVALHTTVRNIKTSCTKSSIQLWNIWDNWQYSFTTINTKFWGLHARPFHTPCLVINPKQ